MGVTVRPDLVGSDLDLYDNRSEAQSDVSAEKVVDLTSLLPKYLLMYATTVRGPLVQLDMEWPDGTRAQVHYYYQELGQAGLAKKAHIQTWAEDLGVLPNDLSRLIFENAPGALRPQAEVESSEKGVNLDELQGEAEKLLGLLNDRHPGLTTWNGFMELRLKNLHKLCSQALRK